MLRAMAVVLLLATPPASISWDADFKVAMRRAREAGKPVMVDFWADWCKWCHELDATTYRDPTVATLARDFVTVKVNTEGSLGEAEIAARYGVETLPTIGFLTPGGRLFLRRTAFEGPERFPATLEEVLRLAKDVIAWEAALSHDDKDAGALAGLGILLFDQKLFTESRDLLRRACKADRARSAAERKRTRRTLALVEREVGKRAESERLLEEALAIQPAEPDEDAAILFARGEACLARGQVEEARAAWRRSLEMAPQGVSAGRVREALTSLPAR